MKLFLNFRRALARANTIRYKLFFSILFFLVIPVLLTFYLMDKPLERVIERNLGSSAQSALNLVGINVNLLLEDMLQSAVQITTNPSIVTLLKDPDAVSGYDKLRLNDAILNRRTSSYFSNTYVTLIDAKGGRLSTSYVSDASLARLLASEWYARMMSKPFQLEWTSVNSKEWYPVNRPLVTLKKTVTEIQTGRNIGMVLFSVAEEDVRKYLAGLEGEVYLVDKSGVIVSGTSKGSVGRLLSEQIDTASLQGQARGQEIVRKGKQKWIVNYNAVQANGWRVVQFVSYDTVFKEIFAIRKTNVLIFLLIFVAFAMITLTISYGISKPLNLLKRRMEELEDKGFHSSIPVKGPGEVAALIATYNKMVKEIRTLLSRLKDEYEQKEDMRFRALQAQINPHFILNTLNNIKWMAYIRSDNDVGDMLSNLGGMLEGSIGRGGSLIPLRQELDYVHNYIGLMKIKFPERLTFETEVPEALADQEVIKIMLQPFVENSLLHGIEPTEGAGEIVVRARAEEDRFLLELTDDGAGIPADKLAELRRRLAEESEARPPERIGIKNVHDRIRLQYGEPYGIDIYSEPGKGTTVVFCLPLKKAMGGMDDAAAGRDARRR
ncbi:sensor histidine kinase [Cohnella sp. GCM10012308]|uniref:sensor histidine kinase n=1 Tax=Cohnella sp. GCM10012308 TaxID=3317329 RepID=UPI0036190ACE